MPAAKGHASYCTLLWLGRPCSTKCNGMTIHPLITCMCHVYWSAWAQSCLKYMLWYLYRSLSPIFYICVDGQKHLVKLENFAAQLFCAAWSCKGYYNSE